jgi:hypothetical protein
VLVLLDRELGERPVVRPLSGIDIVGGPVEPPGDIL